MLVDNEELLKQRSSFKGISNDNSVQRLEDGAQIQKMLHTEDMKDRGIPQADGNDAAQRAMQEEE